MSLESADWISELDITNPAPTDQKKQGDDHLRLLKEVLKNTFPNADKAFYFPTAESQTASFSIGSDDMGKTFLVSTASGAVAATLPTLDVDDDGWECFFIKTTADTNALFVTPASGTIQSGDQTGLAKARRCIPGAKTRVLWTGTAWIAERVVSVPIGTILDIPRSGLPVGYEYANGQTLASASTDYPEFYKANGNSGVVTDRRGRAAFGRDTMANAGGAAGRLGGTHGETGVDTLGQGIGAETKTLDITEIPSHDHSFNTTSGTDSPDHVHNTNDQAFTMVGGGGVPITVMVPGSGNSGGANTRHAHSVSGTTGTKGSGTAFSKVPPGIMTNFMVVVE